MLRSEQRERLEAWAASTLPIFHGQYWKARADVPKNDHSSMWGIEEQIFNRDRVAGRVPAEAFGLD